jgi:ribonuclease HI
LAYRIYSDGASKGNPGPAGVGAVILDAEGNKVAEIAKYIGVTTNNVAEYRALIEALKACLKRKWAPVEIFSDSELLIRQLAGKYKVKNPGILPLHQSARKLIEQLGCERLQHIPREENEEADRLSNLGVAKGYRD